ncbi:hypothetical protein H5410_009429 [Solanum commersonii]|uniref:Band 7 domain-containing protein n=1 Tax=Solanum commersonii TaxID=4109 RepID=A0A9J6AIQ8_SOLCO|nr:hypothetical protein H5410_009429 [Solanum commersonii]
MKIIRKSMQFSKNLSTSSQLFGKHIIASRISSSSSVRNFSTNYKIKPPKNLGIHFVPQQHAYVVERLGKYTTTLNPGLNYLIPFIDKIQYVHSLKEQAILISRQTGITKDNVPIEMDGVLYIRIIDPVLASYGTEDHIYSVVQLAQTTMRSELGKITLDKTFEERVELNRCILNAINDWPLRTDWGLECLRYEIQGYNTTRRCKVAMELQAEAERKKRAKVLISEGQRQAAVNVADGRKMAVILESEAAKKDQVNRAKGKADAILSNAQATAHAISEVSRAILEDGGSDATSLRVAEQYVEVLEKINKMGTVTLLPQYSSDAASLISQAIAIHSKLSTSTIPVTVCLFLNENRVVFSIFSVLLYDLKDVWQPIGQVG